MQGAYQTTAIINKLMTIDSKLKLTFGIISFLLLTTLLFKLTQIPGGMILSGFILGGIVLIGILIGSLILSLLLKLLFKRNSFLTIYSIVISLAMVIFHYDLYSPTLKIKVPNGYKGEIHLVLSNVKDNILTIDTNGIGYVNEWTFNKTYSRPIVEQLDGKNLDKNLVGFNSSAFFAKSVGDGNTIKSLSFKILPDNPKEEKFNRLDWLDQVDRKLILLNDPKKPISNHAIEVKALKN